MAIRKQLGIKSVVQMKTSSESVHVDSGSQENFACEIQNPNNPGLESGIQLKESAIPLKIAIRNPISTKKKSASNTWNPEPNFVLDFLGRVKLKQYKLRSL